MKGCRLIARLISSETGGGKSGMWGEKMRESKAETQENSASEFTGDGNLRNLRVYMKNDFVT